jgi:SAM-dependent methyltransferase
MDNVGRVQQLWSNLVDPADGSTLELVDDGGCALVSESGRRHPVVKDIPRFVARDVPMEQVSTADTFSLKWDRVAGFGHDSATRDFHHAWYLQRYGWKDEVEFGRFLAGCQRVLDAGCGVGRDVVWYRAHAPGLVAGVDISTAVEHAQVNAGPDAAILLAQADLAHLPFPEDYFDFVACDQVLHHTQNPRASFHHLVSRVRSGGILAFYVYRVKGPIREFCDDHLRALATRMPEVDSVRLAEAVTRFGQALTQQQLTIEIPEAIPELGITAGRFDLQRWIYWTVFKCFYNAEWDWNTNVMTNYDWYRPLTAFRNTPEEIRQWIKEEGLEVLHEDLGDAGLSYRCRRPVNRTVRGEE